MKITRFIAAFLTLVFAGLAQAQSAKPNFLFIWGDDIGPFNISAYNRDGTIGARVDELGDDALSQAYKAVMQAIYAREKSASTDTCRFIDQLVDAIRHRDKPRYPLQWRVEIKLN